VLDASGYPDCRPEIIEAFERLARLATRAGVEGRAPVPIRTPLIRIRAFRRKGFAEAGVADPTRYRRGR
jgi:7-cyano-7-deazaguanine synthase in queuosine biosynthesis